MYVSVFMCICVPGCVHICVHVGHEGSYQQGHIQCRQGYTENQLGERKEHIRQSCELAQCAHVSEIIPSQADAEFQHSKISPGSVTCQHGLGWERNRAVPAQKVTLMLGAAGGR